MDKFRTENSIARRVSLAICEAGHDVDSVAEAAGMTEIEMSDRLNGCVEFTLDDLVHVGGFLRASVPDFFKEAA